MLISRVTGYLWLSSEIRVHGNVAESGFVSISMDACYGKCASFSLLGPLV